MSKYQPFEKINFFRSCMPSVRNIIITAIMFAAVDTMAGPRARDLSIPFDGVPGNLNAITDVPGVEVGHLTLNDGKTEGGARTGVTAIFPLGKTAASGVAAATFAFNGAGELTGAHFIDEFGGFFGPILLTGTLSVGVARDAAIEWARNHIDELEIRFTRVLPVVGETLDSGLHDAWGFHLNKGHVFSALDSAVTGPVAEGSVGGGTGMVCYYFKCGIGTSSRVVAVGEHQFTIGILVQANHGLRRELLIAGAPVGKEIADLMPVRGSYNPPRDGSIIIVVATDAPLLPSQLARLARHATVGMARTGGQGNTLSGDIFLAFSTANRLSLNPAEIMAFRAIPGAALDPVFTGVIEATEEAIINALVAGDTMKGGNGGIVYGMPHDRIQKILKKYGRLN